MRELLLEIWTSVRHNKLRTALTGFSVAWGIFMLVILLGSGNGLKHGVLSNFGAYSVNSLVLYGGQTSKPWMGYDKNRNIRLVNNDLEILKREFPEVIEVSAQAWFQGKTAVVEDRNTNVSIKGALPGIADILQIELSAGRFINQTDIDRYRKVAVIDDGTRKVLFGGEDPLGRQVNLGESIYTVVGVWKGDAMDNESLWYLPLSTAQMIYSANAPYIGNAVITVRDIRTDAEMEAFEKRLIARLAIEHCYDPSDKSALWINNQMEMYKNMSLVFGGINVFVWIIGLGTLLAGIVGVSNIMLVTVSERTFEFGIRKALGAKPASIIRLILAESVLITAAFGYIGLISGVAVMEAVNCLIARTPSDSISIFLDPTLDLGIAVSATVVLVLAGLVAGYIPARRAARLKTIDALRYNK